MKLHGSKVFAVQKVFREKANIENMSEILNSRIYHRVLVLRRHFQAVSHETTMGLKT